MGEVNCLVAASLAANSFPPNLQKFTKKDRRTTKRGKNQNKSFPEILKTTRLLKKICKQEFQ